MADRKQDDKEKQKAPDKAGKPAPEPDEIDYSQDGAELDVSDSAEDLADKILTEGLVPAATEIVTLSTHADSESVRASMSSFVIRYHLKKLAMSKNDFDKPDGDKNKKPDSKSVWSELLGDVTRESDD